MLNDPKFDLNDYAYFFHVVEQRGFAPAGRALGIPKSRISRHIRQLEERLGARLLQRTSRQFGVTDAGKEFFRHAKAIMSEVQAAEAAVPQDGGALTGKVRVSCSPGVAQFALDGLVSDFLRQHPGVEIGQHVTNDLVDLIEAGVDIAIRGHAGNLPDSSLIQRCVAKVQWYLFASPAYLDEFGTPRKPDDLQDCAGLCLGWRNDIGRWRLKQGGGETEVIQFLPRLSSDDMHSLKAACAAGLGIVSLPSYVCAEDIRLGRLQRVLPEWISAEATLSLLQPSRHGTAPAVKAFAEHLTRGLQVRISGQV